MRTGAEYRESLRDGRDVWVMGREDILPVSVETCNSVLAEATAGSAGRGVSLEGDAAEVGAGLVAMVAAGL